MKEHDKPKTPSRNDPFTPSQQRNPFQNLFRGFCDPYQPSDVDTVTSTPLDHSNHTREIAEEGDDDVPTEIFKNKKSKKKQSVTIVEEEDGGEEQKSREHGEGEQLEHQPKKKTKDDKPNVPPQIESSTRRKRRLALEIFFVAVLTVCGTLFVLLRSNRFRSSPMKVRIKNKLIDLKKGFTFKIQPKAMDEADKAVDIGVSADDADPAVVEEGVIMVVKSEIVSDATEEDRTVQDVQQQQLQRQIEERKQRGQEGEILRQERQRQRQQQQPPPRHIKMEPVDTQDDTKAKASDGEAMEYSSTDSGMKFAAGTVMTSIVRETELGSDDEPDAAEDIADSVLAEVLADSGVEL